MIPHKKRKKLSGKMHDRRLVGKPRTRRMEIVHRGTLQVLRIQGWRRLA